MAGARSQFKDPELSNKPSLLILLGTTEDKIKYAKWR